MTETATSRGTVSAEEFAALCNLFHTIACEHAEMRYATHIGDILYYGANRTVCDQSRRLARTTLAYLGLRTGVPEADRLITHEEHLMRSGEGTLARDRGNDDPWGELDELPEPGIVYTEEQAIAEGAVRKMDAYGVATFRGDPVYTVSDTLFRALQDTFGLAATAGITVTEADWEATLAERAADGQTTPAIDDLDGRTGLVPPWAALGDLLQVLIAGAYDSAGEITPEDDLYVTPSLKALDNRPIWLQRPKPGEWTAFLPEDY
jgi:hypothetical protein